MDDSKDQPAVKVFDLGNNKLYLKMHDPYGFWHLSLDKGALPESFKGAYTSLQNAEAAAKVYLHEKGKEAKPIVS